MGPLSGVRVVEIAGIGPGPFCAMLLADLGADVIRVDRRPDAPPEGAGEGERYNVLNRGRRSVGVDLKGERGAEVVLRLVHEADALIEGFRPGVAERLGIGPAPCLARNRRLVYGRMTGWGQEGPLASAAGHDITYAATAGALAHIGRVGQLPTPPLNLVADFGGGGMLLALGLVAALHHAQRTGEGQVVDAAMVDGTALLMAPFFGASAIGFWSDERGTNLLDSGAPFYDVYRCGDGAEIAVGAIEPQFFAALLDVLGIPASSLPDQNDQGRWPELRAALTWAFAGRPRSEWLARAEGRDACLAPVLTMAEAAVHPHLQARATIVERDGVPQPAPAPRFSATPATLDRPPAAPGQHTDEALVDWGFSPPEVAELRASGAIG
ncbi:MAG: CaiB/BaiF CoA-transferase family protein [Acidimicrobiales bacterium]